MTEEMISMEEFISDNEIYMTTDGKVANGSLLLNLRKDGMQVTIIWDDNEIPNLGEVLDYMAFVAESVETTSGPAEWLEEYTDLMGEYDETVANVEMIYRECLQDNERLKRLLGDKAYSDLLNIVESPRELH